jgi:hypothetical protein
MNWRKMKMKEVTIDGKKYREVVETQTEENCAECDQCEEHVLQEKTSKRVGVRVLAGGHPDNKYKRQPVIELTAGTRKILIGKSSDVLRDALDLLETGF